MKYIYAALLLAAISSCSNKKLEATVTAVPGTSCSTVTLLNGAIIKCADGTSSVIFNGLNGSNGLNGTNGSNGENGSNSILGYIYPCGTEFANDEIFIRLADGNILAVYDGGDYLSRLVLLAPGYYVTTDRQKNRCEVKVDKELNVYTSPKEATGLAINPLKERE